MKPEKMKSPEVSSLPLLKTDIKSLELEAMMLNKLIQTELSSDAIACFIAAQRVNGALRKNLTPYQWAI